MWVFHRSNSEYTLDIIKNKRPMRLYYYDTNIFITFKTQNLEITENVNFQITNYYKQNRNLCLYVHQKVSTVKTCSDIFPDYNRSGLLSGQFTVVTRFLHRTSEQILG